VLLVLISIPVTVGYLWLIIASFADTTHGLVPYTGDTIGFTLDNWEFLGDPALWKLTLNTFILAAGMTIGTVLVSAMSGYALSRLAFPGRRSLLGGALVLHAFPSFTLLISIFFVLRWIGDHMPVIGTGIPLIDGFGYNTLGGVVLVSIALQLPLGIWLMKGFFDGVSWDMERAALVDGCSRLQAWRHVVMPQVLPGVMALSVFSFIIGWGSFIIPFTYMIDAKTAVLSTYLFALTGETAQVDYGQVVAVGLFQLLPVLLFFLFMQKYLLRIFAGGTRGGV
jgi:inositol-phosphate transport system permease protein